MNKENDNTPIAETPLNSTLGSQNTVVPADTVNTETKPEQLEKKPTVEPETVDISDMFAIPEEISEPVKKPRKPRTRKIKTTNDPEPVPNAEPAKVAFDWSNMPTGALWNTVYEIIRKRYLNNATVLSEAEQLALQKATNDVLQYYMPYLSTAPVLLAFGMTLVAVFGNKVSEHFSKANQNVDAPK